jgi:ATP-dependent DNA helicase RecQ
LREFYSHIEDIEAVELMNKKLTELFERDLAELRTHWRSEKLKQSYPHGSVLINTMSKPTVNVTKLSDIPTDQRERSEIAEDAAQYLGDASLAEGLSEVIACSRRGECVLAIMPKVYDLSLGYALSVLHEPGLSLVLTAQPDNYKESHKILRKQLGDQISLLYWGIDEQLLWPILQDVAAGRCKLLYASPEWLRYSPFLYALSRADLRRIVIEEADRASAWNNDFEPIYYNFEQIHRDLQLPPILALAQTASPRIREDIERVVFASVIPAENRELSIEPSHATEAKEQTTRPHTVYRQIATDTYRNNVYLRAIEAANDEEKLRHLLELCKRLQGSGIVYTRSRKRCEALADKLREEGIDATYYHAGITNRSEVQTWFTEGRIRIIAATIDFDRSLHKPDLRFIIHYGLPPSLDIYYKEIAPAGRDGQPADCTLIYSRNDQKMLKRKIQDKVIETELLRKTYSALRAMLKQINPNIISLADLGESLGCSTEKFALTLNLLERAELFKRYCNIPQSITLRHIASSDDERFGRFVSTLPLSNNQSELHIDTLELSQITHIHLNLLEGYLLRWQTNGYIEYIPHKYNALLELLPTPENVAERIKYLIEQHEIIQECQLEELMEYATSIHCRHGQISRYLGGKTRYRCSNCDNCQS